MKLSEEIAQKLLQINAIRLSPQNPFTWASGIKSPVYCDNRLSLSHPDVRRRIVDGFVEASKAYLPFDTVAGVATAGIAWGALVADRLGLPFVYVRSSAKDHGRQNQVEGELQEGAFAIVIEDLISTGGSSLAAVETLRAYQCQVKAVLAIFQYNFPEAQQMFDRAECLFRTLSDFRTLIRIASQTGHIGQADKALLDTWYSDPRGWQTNTMTHS